MYPLLDHYSDSSWFKIDQLHETTTEICSSCIYVLPIGVILSLIEDFFPHCNWRMHVPFRENVVDLFDGTLERSIREKFID